MKKLLFTTILSAFLVSFTACSDDSSSPSITEKCAELSSDCLKGTWVLSSFEGSNAAVAGKGTLKLTGKNFTYTPAADDLSHTYCPGVELSGEYEVLNATQVKFTLDGFNMVGLCFASKAATVTVTVDPTTLKISGGSIGSTLFVPNDESGISAEVYTRQ